MDLATFRTDFPEFSSATVYTDGQVNFYLGLAAVRMNPLVWDALYDYGVALYVAHCLALAGQRARSGAVTGGTPGINSGPLASKSVKDVSMSYNATIGTIEGAGNYNLTTYGTMFYELMQLVGQGCIQLGAAVGMPGVLVDPFAGMGGFI